MEQIQKEEMSKIFELAKTYQDVLAAIPDEKKSEGQKQNADFVKEVMPLLSGIHATGSYANSGVSCTLERI